jgi:probable F420-dependent oxidoreductase
MKFTFVESMCDPAQYIPLAKAAEAAGWDSFAVPDSLCYPEFSDSTYPYNPDGTRTFLEDKPFLDPFTQIAAMGAVTEKIRFTTFVVKLTIREPVLVAKTAASLAVQTNNRFGFGVGLSPWPEDFQVCNQPWKGRGKRMNEMIEIIRGLTTGGFFAFEGEHYNVPSIKMCPTPTKPIPFLIGGHSKPALRRAARLGDGWMHAGGDPETLKALHGQLKEMLKEEGRENDPFEIHVISMDGYSVDGIKRLEDIGVTDCIIGFRNPYEGPDTMTLQEKIDGINMFADGVIAKTR